MATFEIDTAINKLVDKLADELNIKVKKAIIKSEKQTLKQYIASQKITVGKKEVKNIKTPPRREQDYRYKYESDSSSEYDSEYSA